MHIFCNDLQLIGTYSQSGLNKNKRKAKLASYIKLSAKAQFLSN